MGRKDGRRMSTLGGRLPLAVSVASVSYSLIAFFSWNGASSRPQPRSRAGTRT